MSVGSYGTEPEEWLREQEARVTALTEQADQVRQELRDAGATTSSRDGSVTVTVNAGGQLQNLRLSPKVEKLTPVRLAATILDTYQRACVDATRSTIDLMSGLIGDDAEAMAFLRQQLPADPDADEEDGR